ncbi:DIP1281 family NlpC/P60 protein [Corynebacterium poyangense]|uniref:DIP1281 family NlpC/P60 protein n=1 Tax=Corynebacterium poyangense TaxID=2684405 RepID=UPI00165CF9AC|nr:NlpC/P60 family protein [Corynebacterium poyangense]
MFNSTPRRHGRLVTRSTVATVLCAAMLSSTASFVHPGVANAAPTNPSNTDIQNALDAIRNSQGNVAGLAGAIAQVQDEINKVELHMGELREGVNKALVDLHDAQATAEQARQGVRSARDRLNTTQREIEDAQKKLDEISRTAYRHSNTGGIEAAASDDAARDALDRQTYLRTNAEEQQQAISALDQARTEHANEESRLRAARDLAEQRESEAAAAKDAAESRIQETSGQLAAENARRQDLMQQRDLAQAELDGNREKADELHQQRKEYEAYQQAEQERAAAEEAARQAAEQRRQAEDAARQAKAEADRERREKEAEEARRSEEQKEAERKAKANQAAQAAAALIAAASAAHNQTENPYPQGEDAANATISAVHNAGEQNPNVNGTEVPLGQVPTLDSVSEAAGNTAGAAQGSRDQKIETVINRAMSQLGVPYAWGGGTATGPSQGIRDGGVADSYGDYNKIGFDCSGLVLYAYAGIGIALPHYTGYQYQYGTKVNINEIQRGDLLFWGPNAEYHVAIYLGNGQMIEAPQSGSVVQVSSVRYAGMSPYAVRLI